MTTFLVVIGDTESCRRGNVWWHQWRQRWHHDDSVFSVIMPPMPWWIWRGSFERLYILHQFDWNKNNFKISFTRSEINIERFPFYRKDKFLSVCKTGIISSFLTTMVILIKENSIPSAIAKHCVCVGYVSREIFDNKEKYINNISFCCQNSAYSGGIYKAPLGATPSADTETNS